MNRSPVTSARPAASTRDGMSRFDVFFASAWLVFLISPAVRLWDADAGAGVKTLGWIGLFVFGAVYVVSWIHPRPLPSLGDTATVWAWFSALVVCALTMVPTIGLGVLSIVPYLVALLIFRLPLRAALALSSTLVAGAILLTWLIDPDQWVWVLPMTLMSLLIMGLIRVTAEHEERGYRIAHELDLSREREEVARDVHDILGHSLTVVAVKTELARKLVDRDPQRARAELDDVLALTREALAEVRSTVGRLRSPVWAAQVASARTALTAAGIEARLPSDPDVVPEDQQEVFAWCLRESVTNVVRHSEASRCTVAAEPGLLTVTDDGVGVGTHALAGGAGSGNGIAGMRERVGEHGGTVSVGPAPGATLTASAHRAGRPGTRVEVRLP